ncbi:transposase [Anopheles sinensis]|uniref:Transposase n=1 Tax=Anopheles sinensis TaxID=74873 RepID=A0A084WA26_ANOSI|nr:transposase [Anopheles sinensis]
MNNITTEPPLLPSAMCPPRGAADGEKICVAINGSSTSHSLRRVRHRAAFHSITVTMVNEPYAIVKIRREPKREHVTGDPSRARYEKNDGAGFLKPIFDQNAGKTNIWKGFH